MEFPDSYFEDEVREGFYICSLMKRAWAAQAEVLDAVRRICETHHIRYFAEWGTLLGAIRHGGRVPWDDDVDICMLREDYDRFRAVADDELPEGCWFMDYQWSDDFDHLIGRIINSRVLVVEGEALEKYHGFPYVAGIDIFCLDDLPTDPEEEEAYFETVHYLITLINEIRLDKEGIRKADPVELESHIRHMEELCHVSFDRSKPVKQQLYALLEKKVGPKYAGTGAEEITSLPWWKKNRRYRVPKECYADAVAVPFENTEIMVPAGYMELLRRKYGGNWVMPIRAGSAHEYPSYEEQQEFLRKENAGQLFEYPFSKEEIQEAEAARLSQRQAHLSEQSLKEKVIGFLPLFREAHGEIQSLLESGDAESALGLLGECQNVAIEIGTMIEEEVGEGCATVRVLEQYCENIFLLHQKLQEAADELNISLQELTAFPEHLADSAKKELKEKKEVVFVPYKASLWGAMESVWQAALAEEDTLAFVIPAPYYYKDAYGKAKSEEPHYETDYPDYVTVTSYEEYNFESHHPDMIIIQCPYDEYNYGFTIHPFFYAKNLKQYTEQLVYIPPFVMDEIGPDDDRAKKMLKSFCNMPGVVHADTVIVQSEQMKDVYIELLSEFAGEDTRTVWEEKIQGIGSPLYDAAR
ncbi:MAG: LicD family protein [Roseburia sp.]|nr:LicD family protein [Roseburia sp.]